MRMMLDEKVEELVDDMFNFDSTPFKMTLKEAVERANFPDTKEIMEACSERTNIIKEKWKGVLTEDDIKAILIYTYEYDNSDAESPYKIVNTNLASRSVSALRKIRGYVLYLLRALRKLPRYGTGSELYRGIDGKDISRDKYSLGKDITWSSFTSTTTNKEVARKFAEDSEAPLLFVIRGNYIGYNIEKLSFREKEKGI